jgi:hypothetical protein
MATSSVPGVLVSRQGGVNLVFGVPAAVLAAIAGGAGLAGVAGRVSAAVMALVSAGLSERSRRSTPVGA